MLFEAQWITHDGADLRSDLDWSATDDFTAWTTGWSGGEPQEILRPELLHDPGVVLLAGIQDGEVVAGAIAHRSDGVIGVGNVFGPPEQAWPGLIGHLTRRFPATPLVGYEHGDDLAVARRFGCRPIGPLRVWVSAAA
ncbi:hypothetical protein F4553_007732 [Allocatelliglobosispora scoriae]|uniref:GNAT family N-acetyltransferase n=1 Tax=Allocatelliglobosispora scoriae TaxID=643052 RepID=A0A841C3F4_9ACTN|nr:hypothetical protein [Allocatelliglobosispora scoriae]MBB5874298.1 hypothetical protein [Allocatelliglobosispora scoriae]